MSEAMGLDVSHYQGAIDWSKVAQAGKRFVVMKAMYEAQSHRKDEFFEANYKGAGENGLSRGVYIFIASASIRDPQGDASALLKHLADRPLEYGIWLDFEADVLANRGKEKIEELAYTYANIFRSAGYYTGIYCNKYWYETYISDNLKDDFEFWIARIPKDDKGEYNPESKLRPDYTRTVGWQYSHKGSCPGVNGTVDLDVDYDGIVGVIAQEPYLKTDLEIAAEVLKGKWGTKDTSPTREELLTRAGYDYEAIRKIVNDYLALKRMIEA